MHEDDDLRPEQAFRVLFVCTGNLCRSPIAQHQLARALHDIGVEWSVGSAGILARDGNPMHPLAGAVLSEREIPHEGWTTHKLRAAMIDSADLVLTAEVSHRQAVVTMAPAAVRYSFTLLEFSQLLGLSTPGAEHTDREAGVALIKHAVLARSKPQSRDPQLIEIPDPIDEPIAAFRAAADITGGAISEIIRSLPDRFHDTNLITGTTTSQHPGRRPRPGPGIGILPR